MGTWSSYQLILQFPGSVALPVPPPPVWYTATKPVTCSTASEHLAHAARTETQAEDPGHAPE